MITESQLAQVTLVGLMRLTLVGLINVIDYSCSMITNQVNLEVDNIMRS